jgi:hypothetical protein
MLVRVETLAAPFEKLRTHISKEPVGTANLAAMREKE